MQLVIAAALAVVAALAEFTIVPYLKIGDAVLQPVLVFGVIWAIAGGLEAGLAWAFVGGLALDILGQRPLGSSAFAMLVAIGLASVIGGLLGRVRIIAPVIATAIVSPVYSMLLLVSITALSSAPLSSAAFDSVLPTAIYNTVLAALVGTPGRRRSSCGARPRSGWTGERLADRAQPRARPPADPVPRLRDHHDPGVRDADDPPGLPPDHQRRCRSPPAPRRSGPRTSRSRPPRGLIYDRQGPPPRQQRRDLGRQDHAVRPAVLRARRRRPAPRRPARHRRRRRSWPRSTARPAPGSTRSASPQDVPEETARLVAESSDELPGVQVVVETRREYPDGPLLAHILGYTGPDRRRPPTRSCAARATSRTT